MNPSVLTSRSLHVFAALDVCRCRFLCYIPGSSRRLPEKTVSKQRECQLQRAPEEQQEAFQPASCVSLLAFCVAGAAAALRCTLFAASCSHCSLSSSAGPREQTFWADMWDSGATRFHEEAIHPALLVRVASFLRVCAHLSSSNMARRSSLERKAFLYLCVAKLSTWRSWRASLVWSE